MKATMLLMIKPGQPTKGPCRAVCRAPEPPKSPRRRFLRGWSPRAGPSPTSSGTGCPLNGARGLVRGLGVSRTTQWSSGCRLWRWWIFRQGHQLRRRRGDCLRASVLVPHWSRLADITARPDLGLPASAKWISSSLCHAKSTQPCGCLVTAILQYHLSALQRSHTWSVVLASCLLSCGSTESSTMQCSPAEIGYGQADSVTFQTW